MRLETDSLDKRFGGIVALGDVSLDFLSGTVTAIIGPNGAGKSTLFNVIAGFLQPDSGSVFLLDDDQGTCSGSNHQKDIVGLAPHRIALNGLGILFQDIRVFGKLSVYANVAAGIKKQSGENPINAIFRPKLVRTQEKVIAEKVRHLLAYVGLSDKDHLLAEQLSYGQQKLLAIARLLAGDSKVLLLDEPTSGVHPTMVKSLLQLIRQLAEDLGCVVVIIEHNLNVVREVGEWIYLMVNGRVEVFGKPSEVLHDDAILRLFPTL